MGSEMCIRDRTNIFDDTTVLTGSQNVTKNGFDDSGNSEHAFRIRCPNAVAEALSAFEKEWLVSAPPSPDLLAYLRGKVRSKEQTRSSRSKKCQPSTPLIKEPPRAQGDGRLRHLPGTRDSRTREQAKREVARVLQAGRRGRAAQTAHAAQQALDCGRIVEEIYPEDNTPSHSPTPGLAD